MTAKPGLSVSAVQASRDVRTVISRLRRCLLNASEVEDLSFGQESVLVRLADRNGVTASDLAAAEGVRHQSMTATVGSLAARGLVERRPDPHDGRRQLLTLTAEGKRRSGPSGPGRAISSWTAPCAHSRRSAARDGVLSE